MQTQANTETTGRNEMTELTKAEAAHCGYCKSEECRCECTLLWEIRHNVGRGADGYDYTKTEDYARLVERGLLNAGGTK